MHNVTATLYIRVRLRPSVVIKLIYCMDTAQ